MGTWGPGNLENDYALDELGERSQKLVNGLLRRARSKRSREADEYDHTTLFVEFEILFALDARKLLSAELPDPNEVETLKQRFLKDWDAHIDALEPKPDYKRKRRQVIARTFDRFKRICARHRELGG